MKENDGKKLPLGESPKVPDSIKTVSASNLRVCTVNSDTPIYAGRSDGRHDFPYEHIHTHWEVIVALSGKLRHTVNGETRIMNRGDACVLRPNDRHLLSFCTPSSSNIRIDLFFSCELCKQLISPFTSYDELIERKEALYFSLDALSLEYVSRKMTNYSLSANDFTANAMVVNSLLMAFIDHEQSYNRSYPGWLNDFLLVLNSPQNFDKKISDLVKLTPYSHSGLSQSFKRYLGMPLVKYFNQAKMLYAKQLLLTTNRTTLEIAIELGYDSLSTFNHNFKDMFNLSPSEMRRSGYTETSILTTHFVSSMPKNGNK